MKQNVEVKTTGLYPGKEYTLDVVRSMRQILRSCSLKVMIGMRHMEQSIRQCWARIICRGLLVIASLYEDGEWINTVRRCHTIEEPEPPRIQFTYLRYNDYHINHYVDTSVVNMVFGNNYTLDVQLVNNSTGYVMVHESDTINASYLN